MRRMPLDQRRAEIIDAAVRVIARDGLAEASTRAIVAEADMPLGSLHYVFESREELLRTLITEIATQERAAILSALETGVPASVENLVRTGLETYLRMLEANPEQELAVAELSLHGARHDPELAMTQWETYFAVAAESLERGAELCHVAWTLPVNEIAKSLISVLDGLTLTWLGTRDSASMRRHIDFLAHAFAGLAVPTGDAD